MVIVRQEGFMSMKNFNHTIGNRNRDFPGCSAVPQPTVPPRAGNDQPVILVLTTRGTKLQTSSLLRRDLPLNCLQRYRSA